MDPPQAVFSPLNQVFTSPSCFSIPGKAVGLCLRAIRDSGVKIWKYTPWTLFLWSHPYPCPCSSLLHIPVGAERCQSANKGFWCRKNAWETPPTCLGLQDLLSSSQIPQTPHWRKLILEWNSIKVYLEMGWASVLCSKAKLLNQKINYFPITFIIPPFF